jgi:hypothetical protein
MAKRLSITEYKKEDRSRDNRIATGEREDEAKYAVSYTVSIHLLNRFFSY